VSLRWKRTTVKMQTGGTYIAHYASVSYGRDSSGVTRGHSLQIRKFRGKPFVFAPHATRDGQLYGAIPKKAQRSFDTLQEAKDYAYEFVARMAGRYSE
jgi:hypothetical protein